MEQSNEITELAKALCKAQTSELFALTDSENPFFKSKYADLSSVWSAIRTPVTDNGLSIVQTFDSDGDGSVVIVTTLMHSSGQWIRGRLPIKPVKPDPQSLGSAITYGRRYSLAAVIGVCPEDDDGEKGMSRNGKPKTSPMQPPPQKVETITEQQAADIYTLINEVNADGDKFLNYFGVADVEGLPKSKHIIGRSLSKSCDTNLGTRNRKCTMP